MVRERHGFGVRQRLEGLMTGLIDLTYRHDGRWYVLDYKSNRLPAYDAASLQRAMQHSEYYAAQAQYNDGLISRLSNYIKESTDA